MCIGYDGRLALPQGLPRCRHGPVVSCQVRDAGETKVRRVSQESLGASAELLAESRSQKVPL